MAAGLYHSIVCPDPCYDPHWVALADSALFTDGARPMTQMRIRTDFGWRMNDPDKAEFFWAKINGKGPRTPAGQPANAGERSLDYRAATLYNEGAKDRIGLFVEVGYLQVIPETFQAHSGFGDMNVGTKTLLLDSELVQGTFQFRTFIPTGNFLNGIGNAHVSLEPSLIMSMKLAASTYMQGQLAYWIPVGGTAGAQGTIFHYHGSLNQLLWCCGKDIQLIGTLEMNGYEIVSGSFTNINGTVGRAKDVGDLFAVGPGVRFTVGPKIDFGLGALFSLTGDRFAEELLRGEFRWRF
jgi:hypothetical protein